MCNLCFGILFNFEVSFFILSCPFLDWSQWDRSKNAILSLSIKWTLVELLFSVFQMRWRGEDFYANCQAVPASCQLPNWGLFLFWFEFSSLLIVFCWLPNFVFSLFLLLLILPFLNWFQHFGHYLYLLVLNLKLAFSTSFKNNSCEQLGKSMRSAITQYLHIFDMWWNLSCLLARRVLSHTA